MNRIPWSALAVAAVWLAAPWARADAPIGSPPSPLDDPMAVELRPLPPPPPPPGFAPRLPSPEPLPARRRPPPPLTKYTTSLVLNAAALAGNPFDSAIGWRVEAGVEQRLRKSARMSSAVLLSGGSVEPSGYPALLVLGGTGQLRGYFLGDFDQGAYAGAEVGFWYLGGRYAWAPGALVGMKFRTWMATVDLQLAAAWPADSFGQSSVPTNAAWRALAPGLLVGVGLSI